MSTASNVPDDPLLEVIADRWWAFVVRGVAALLFGALTLVMPGASLLALVYTWGVFAIVDSVFALATAARSGRAGGRWGWFLLEGVVSIAAGVLTFAWPGITGLVLLALIAGWAILAGVAQIGAAVRLRHVIEREWLLGLSGALSVLFGVALIVRPGVGALAVAWAIGGYAIAFGALLIGLGIKLRGHRRTHEPAAPTHGAHAPA